MYKNGFTLIEIMIVVAIIAVTAALAIPNMLRSRITVNEVAAIAACRLISNACQAYYANHIPHVYPTSLSDLIKPGSDPPYIDDVLAGATTTDMAKQGYYYIYQNFPEEEQFTLNAEPKNERTGKRHFYVDQDGFITANATGMAGPNDTPVP